MKITDKEKSFLKANREVLTDIFSKRIEKLKTGILTCLPEERDGMIRFVKELNDWLVVIKVFSKAKKKDKESFI